MQYLRVLTSTDLFTEEESCLVPVLGWGAWVVCPSWRGGDNVGLITGPRPVMTPGFGVCGLGINPGVGIGPAVGWTGHWGTLQQVGSDGSAIIIQFVGTLVYLAHLSNTGRFCVIQTSHFYLY